MPHVLVVDDEAANRQVLQRILEREPRQAPNTQLRGE